MHGKHNEKEIWRRPFVGVQDRTRENRKETKNTV